MSKTGIDKECEICGAPMYVQLWRIKRGHGRFCSVKCKSVYLGTLFAGENSAVWKGGQYTNKDGYVYVRNTDHPRSINNYVKRAVLVLEEKLGRYLFPNEISHHKNSIKDDDRPDNLEAMSRTCHNRHHGSINQGKDSKAEITCQYCGAVFRDYLSNRRRFCSRSCMARHLKPRLGTGKDARI